jgi:hypothetical protein
MVGHIQPATSGYKNELDDSKYKKMVEITMNLKDMGSWRIPGIKIR